MPKLQDVSLGGCSSRYFMVAGVVGHCLSQLAGTHCWLLLRFSASETMSLWAEFMSPNGR